MAGRGCTCCGPWSVVVALLVVYSHGQGLEQAHILHDLQHTLLGHEVNARLSELGQVTDQQGSLERTFFSPAHRQAAKQLEAWFQEAGLQTWQDSLGNVHGRIAGPPGAPAILLGSHYDTVRDGGHFDGALGIVVGLAAVKVLALEAAVNQSLLHSSQLQQLGASNGTGLGALLSRGAALQLPTPVELIAFSEEEGVRFGTTFLGSTAVTGALLRPPSAMHKRDPGGASVAQVLQQHGKDASEGALRRIAMVAQQVKGYVEVHLEQGPVLEAAGQPLGVVVAIAGQTRVQVSMKGGQGHAGTVPMRLRRDPLAAAAEAIAALEQRCGGGRHNGPSSRPEAEAADDSLVCTVGELRVWPGASNVIPGSANFTVDIRSQDDGVRQAVVAAFQHSTAGLCRRRQVECSVDVFQGTAAVHSDPGIVDRLRQAALQAVQGTSGAAGTEQEQCSNPALARAVPQLVSGAGHDAMAMAELTRVGMLFVRCRGGISHSPLEHVEDDDVALSAMALFLYLRNSMT